MKQMDTSSEMLLSSSSDLEYLNLSLIILVNNNRLCLFSSRFVGVAFCTVVIVVLRV